MCVVCEQATKCEALKHPMKCEANSHEVSVMSVVAAQYVGRQQNVNSLGISG